MQLRQLGSTSTNVPAVGLGTWRFVGDLTSVLDSALAEGAWQPERQSRTRLVAVTPRMQGWLR